MFSKSTKIIFWTALLASQNDLFFGSAAVHPQVVDSSNLEDQISRRNEAAAAARAEIQDHPVEAADEVVEEYLEKMERLAANPDTYHGRLDAMWSELVDEVQAVDSEHQSTVKIVLKKRTDAFNGDYVTPVEFVIRANANVDKEKVALNLISDKEFDALWKMAEELSEFWVADPFEKPTWMSRIRGKKNAYGGHWKTPSELQADYGDDSDAAKLYALLKAKMAQFNQQIKDQVRNAAQALSHQRYGETKLEEEFKEKKFERFEEPGKRIFNLQNEYLTFKRNGKRALQVDMTPEEKANAFLMKRQIDLVAGLSGKGMAKWLNRVGKDYYQHIIQKINQKLTSSSPKEKVRLRFLFDVASQLKKEASQTYLRKKRRDEKWDEKQRVMRYVAGNPNRKDSKRFRERLQELKAADAAKGSVTSSIWKTLVSLRNAKKVGLATPEEEDQDPQES